MFRNTNNSPHNASRSRPRAIIVQTHGNGLSNDFGEILAADMDTEDHAERVVDRVAFKHTVIVLSDGCRTLL